MGRESDDRTLYVSSLDEKVTEELLYELFLQAGPIKPWDVALKKRQGAGGNSPASSFAFITFEHVESVPYAMEQMAGVSLFGRKLVLKPREGGVHAEKARKEAQLMRERGRPSYEGVPHFHPLHEGSQPTIPGVGPGKADRDVCMEPLGQRHGYRQGQGAHLTPGFALHADSHDGPVWMRDDVMSANPFSLTRRDVAHYEREERLRREEDFFGNYKRVTALERSEAEERQRGQARERDWEDRPRGAPGTSGGWMGPRDAGGDPRRHTGYGGGYNGAQAPNHRRDDEDWSMPRIRGRIEDTWDGDWRQGNASSSKRFQRR